MKKFISLLLLVCALSAVFAFSACGKKSKLSSYDISVSYNPETCTLSGTSCVDYYNSTQNELSDLKFNLYGNAYREGAKYSPVSSAYSSRAYYNGQSYGKMTVESVENCAGWNIAGEDENILTVNLTEPVYPGGHAKINISYTLTLAQINHRTGITQNCVNLGNFYPVLCAYSADGFVECNYYFCGDPFLSECANYTVTLETPQSYKVASSGKLRSETVTGDTKKGEYVLENARDFAFVLSEKFNVASAKSGDVEVYYYYVEDAGAERCLDAAVKSLEFFAQKFGAYAYPTLSVVQTGFCYGGMEYPALTMIADGHEGEDNVYTIVHENAHQWWYAMVGSDQLTCGWQDEGLAEYSTLAFFESNPDYGYTRAGLVGAATRSYRAFFSVYNQLNGSVDTTMNRNLGAYSGEFEYNNVTYNKSLIMFDTLRKSLGDEKFFGCLNAYFKQNRFKIASPESLIAAFCAAGDVEGLFDSFISGKIII